MNQYKPLIMICAMVVVLLGLNPSSVQAGITFDKTLYGTTFDDAISQVTDLLSQRGFHLVATIDVQKTMKETIDKEMHPYTILQVSSPRHAFQALSLENKVGSILGYINIVVQETAHSRVEVSAIDPVSLVHAVQNPQFSDVAQEIRQLIREVINEL
uniref:Uncharacterized conserved protein, DUF302 family n=1 Tax=Candidatus Kentrum sp. LFY TaxID=2126342 RepID=A0A450WMA7_9GAMM|nr:MAG: Uncharacterized conserved protein, DUF302 family [Candidatus Kentron sp. LFY]